jgi:hypothetical protein
MASSIWQPVFDPKFDPVPDYSEEDRVVNSTLAPPYFRFHEKHYWSTYFIDVKGYAVVGLDHDSSKLFIASPTHNNLQLSVPRGTQLNKIYVSRVDGQIAVVLPKRKHLRVTHELLRRESRELRITDSSSRLGKVKAFLKTLMWER